MPDPTQPAAPQTSGADMARQALAQYKATSSRREQPGNRKPIRRRKATRGDGRDPIGVGSVLTSLNTAYEWNVALEAGSIIDQWASICPELVDKVVPERYDAATGRLDLRPVSPAYAAHLRLLGGQLAGRLNSRSGANAVRAIRVLPPGPPPPGDHHIPARTEPQPIQPASPRTRDDAHPGYHQALEAAQAARGKSAADPRQELRDRYFAGHRDLREPETVFAADQVARQQAAPTIAPSGGNAAEEIRQAALKRARDEKAGRVPAVPQLFDRTA